MQAALIFADFLNYQDLKSAFENPFDLRSNNDHLPIGKLSSIIYQLLFISPNFYKFTPNFDRHFSPGRKLFEMTLQHEKN